MGLSVLAVAGIASSLISGIGNAYNRNVQIKEKEKELNVSKQNLEDSYNLAVRSYQLQDAQLKETSALEINQAESARDRALKQSATSQALQRELYDNQMATLAVEASQAEGQAIQNQAISGLRNIGSAQNTTKNINSIYSNQLSAKRMSINLENYQSYQSALNSYLDSNAQLERYRLNLKQAFETNEINLESMNLDYQQKKRALDEDINYMDSTEFKISKTLGFASDLFGGIVGAGNVAYQHGMLEGIL